MGLYSNILHEYGLQTIEYWLDKFPKSLHSGFSKDFVLESAKFTLENNNLKSDKSYFNEIKGTGIATIFDPTYANLTLGSFKHTFYNLCRKKIGEDLESFIFENWSRLAENKINPNNLVSILNSINPSIQFTMEYSKDAIFSGAF